MTYVFKWMDSPVGRLKLVAGKGGLAAILWENEQRRFPPFDQALEDGSRPILTAAEYQLGDYFAGRRRAFSLPLAFEGTPFQRAVWSALLTIPHGEIRTYSDIARQIGKPRAVRAVGAANGRNPISIVAPCHRVVGSNGALTGFAGGLDAKAYLLTLEGARQTA
jgi:methylated-DNA-[protein]-cysteine S-methyltransferase